MENGAKDSQKAGSGDQAVEVDGKKYTVEDVKSLLGNAEKVAKESGKVARILEASKAYGLDPDEFLEQSSGAFAVVGKLIQQGVIDQNGELVLKKDDKDDDLDDKGKDKGQNIEDLFKLDKGKTLSVDGGTKAVLKALEDIHKKLGTFETALAETQDLQTSLIREKYETQIATTYPNLDQDDISKIFGYAARLRREGKRGDLFEVAKTVSEKKDQQIAAAHKKWAEEHGLNYDEIVAKQADMNRLKEEGPGGLPANLKGKKFSFLKKGEGFVSPKEAARELLNQRLDQAK